MTIDYFLLVLLACLIAGPVGIVIGWFGARWMDRHYPIETPRNGNHFCIHCTAGEGDQHQDWCSRQGVMVVDR
jgi:hypothetical protein